VCQYMALQGATGRYEGPRDLSDDHRIWLERDREALPGGGDAFKGRFVHAAAWSGMMRWGRTAGADRP
jgi:hypothetical protein